MPYYNVDNNLQEELDLTAPNKAAMLSLPSQKKWQIYCSRKGGEDTVDHTHAPEHYVERLRTLATVSLAKEVKTRVICLFAAPVPRVQH
jgi:hypothetical protein